MYIPITNSEINSPIFRNPLDLALAEIDTDDFSHKTNVTQLRTH